MVATSLPRLPTLPAAQSVRLGDYPDGLRSRPSFDSLMDALTSYAYRFERYRELAADYVQQLDGCFEPTHDPANSPIDCYRHEALLAFEQAASGFREVQSKFEECINEYPGGSGSAAVERFQPLWTSLREGESQLNLFVSQSLGPRQRPDSGRLPSTTHARQPQPGPVGSESKAHSRRFSHRLD